ncbi:MAG TPA: glycosyltransferase family 2 protein [Ktedonobacteraceae bacterium]|nr:glycosyltransferase family 2 protein [Ktedonobacteraceae bacterium]
MSHQFEQAHIPFSALSFTTTGSDAAHAEDRLTTNHSLSVVLPAYNEEHVIVATIQEVLTHLDRWGIDYEIIVVNDGSKDQTADLVRKVSAIHPQVRLINHALNQGYGAALVSGFAAASKSLTFFMDSDGQFAIQELHHFFSFIETYDAVLGYRINRRDTWMRKMNARGWKLLIHLVLGVSVRDIDCAFKLIHTQILHDFPLETRGAMINTELLYKMKRSHHIYKEIGVHHFPRLAGRATGAKPSVILRAIRELFSYAIKWRREERFNK